jgi:predicted O-methyltransferase YrrM
VNPILDRIFKEREVTDGSTVYPLGHYHMDADEGGILQRAIKEARPRHSLEVGMAYGISTLFICDALAEQGDRASHIVIDPFQRTDWHGVGLYNVHQAGYDHLVKFYEERSEFVLPRLLAEEYPLDFALIDGWHSFDQALVEFYYINRMLRVGGIVVFDDADWPGLNRLLRYIVEYPAYEVLHGVYLGKSSLLGRARKRVVEIPAVSRAIHPSLRRRTWDLGLLGTCVALRKIAEDQREMTWHPDF